MKWLLILLVAVSTSLGAQDSVTVPRSMLTKEQLASTAITDSWAGRGREVGIAVNGALGAVTEQAGKFGETKIGKVTMGIVVWKVLGKDLMGLVWGFAVFLICVPVILWSYRRYLPSRTLVKVTGGLFSKDRVKEWQVVDPTKNGDDAVWTARLLHGFALILVVVASSCAIFGPGK